MAKEKKKNSVKVDINHEYEFKIALKVNEYLRGREDVLAEELWKSFLDERRKQCARELGLPIIRRESGRTIQAPFEEKIKPQRVRQFGIDPVGYPRDIEVRREGLKTMIKIGNGASDDDPVVSRTEISIERKLSLSPKGFESLPDKAREKLRSISGDFNCNLDRLVPALQTVSYRRKAIVQAVHDHETLGRLVVDVEWALDIGAGETMAGQKWDITEYEGEVKAIRLESGVNDIKKHPELAGLSEKDIQTISKEVLVKERAGFLNFAAGHWQYKELSDRVSMEPVYRSKSRPGLDMLAPLLKTGGNVAIDALATVRRSGFKVVPELADLAGDPRKLFTPEAGL